MVDRDAPIPEAELHAYVDGELPSNRRAAVEAWLAAHPQDAARVAAWRAQADLINARYAAVAQEPIPPRLDLDRLGRIDRRRPLLALAAVVAAFVLGGLAGWFGRDTWAGGISGLRVFTADAIDAHKLYVVEVRHPVEVAGANRPTWCSGSRSGLAMTCARLSWRNWAQARWRTPAARRERRRRRARHVRRPVGRALHHLLRAV
jgi:anti-sigma factor RsiW